MLAKCIKSEAYADAVKYYTGAMPIFKAYGDSSFQECKRASEEAVAIIIKALQGKVFSDSESIQARAEAVMLLKQLDFPVNNLKVQLFKKLEEFLVDLHLESQEIRHSSSDLGGIPLSPSSCAHEASIREFAEAVRAYRVIFPDSEQQLFRLAKTLATKAPLLKTLGTLKPHNSTSRSSLPQQTLLACCKENDAYASFVSRALLEMLIHTWLKRNVSREDTVFFSWLISCKVAKLYMLY
ncbi:vacuolar protein sorting-associated protein 51 homolog [Nicotiana sylvestris]|uniref:vacuolar protein sorting-associated protein 51 homolog n=1 Tax=Nicotiana sylvestris TaxID=4096 RepID=UPI00388CB456